MLWIGTSVNICHIYSLNLSFSVENHAILLNRIGITQSTMGPNCFQSSIWNFERRHLAYTLLQHLMKIDTSFFCNFEKFEEVPKIDRPITYLKSNLFYLMSDSIYVDNFIYLTLIGMREGTFQPLSFLDQILSAEFISKISKLFWKWKLTLIGLIWHPAKLIESYKKWP